MKTSRLKMDKDKRKIVESVFNIDMIARYIGTTIHENIKARFRPGSVIHGAMISYFTIQVCSILDEIEILNAIAKNNDYLRDTLKIISPINRALKKFTGFRKARNIMLAHFNRDKNGNFQPWWYIMKNLKLPRGAENKDILVWISMMNSILVSRYYDDLKSFTQEVSVDYKEYRAWELSDSRDSMSRDYFKGVLKQVEKNANELGIENIKL